MRVAGAPISWGVSELPGWGYRMPPERVLAEMASLGLQATELGPPGYLPADPAGLRALLDRHGLRLVAGFLATVLHDGGQSPGVKIDRQAAILAAGGASVLVLAAAYPGDGYDAQASLGSTEWTRLVERLEEAEHIARRHGLELAFHPHAGTAVASAQDVRRMLSTSAVGLCLDTGHLFLGGADPAALARDAAGRVRHVHIKDVKATIAERLRRGEISYAEAVRGGLYTPLGAGDLDIESVLSRLQEIGYDGWFVLEQDSSLAAEPGPHAGPVAAARQSLDYFRRISGAGPAAASR
ncbi:MAG TPA: TIM barrel protein [Candidatus Dormibacteraeota bacterium]